MIRTLIETRQPQILQQDGIKAFKVSLIWLMPFVRNHLNLSYMKVTWTARKLPTNWEKVGLKMAQRVAYLVKAYSNSPKLFVNTNQTDIHLILKGGAYTWNVKGSKHMFVYGVDDKRQIIVSTSSTSTGNIIHF